MSEYDDLKQKLLEVMAILKSLAIRWIKKADVKLAQKIPNPTHRIVLVTVILSFLVGSLFGSMLSGLGQHGGKSSGFSLGSISFMKTFFGKSIPVPGKQKDGSFVLSNFEKESDLKAWRLMSAQVELSDRNTVEGKQSAHVVLMGGEEMSSIQMDDYFESRGAQSDWSDFGLLQFYIFNPRKESDRLILQVKDRNGSRYKQDIFIPGDKGQTFNIPIDKIGGRINVRKIEQFNLFRWKPKTDREYYLDDIRLIPKSSRNKAEKEKIDIKPSKERPVNMTDYGFVMKKPAWVVDYVHDVGVAVRIPFILKNETRSVCRNCAAGGGIPLPMGEVKDQNHFRLKNAASELLPFQTRVLSKWPDGSIKWLGLHFLTDLNPGQGSGYFLEYGDGIQNPGGQGIQVDDGKKSLVIKTGPMEAEIDKDKFYLFKKITVDLNKDGQFSENEVMIQDAPLVLGFDGEEYRADLDDNSYEIKIEEKGGERIVIRAKGWFQSEKGKRFCQVILRYYFYQGQSSIKVSHTLIYTGFPENRYYDIYKGLKLPKNEPIDSFGLSLPLRMDRDQPRKMLIGFERDGWQELPTNENIKIWQLEWEKAVIDRNGSMLESSDFPTGWMDISSSRGGVAVSLRDFRENFPKGFRFDPKENVLHLDLWPKEANVLDLATTSNAFGPEAVARGSAFGLGKTHEMLFYFHGGDSVASYAFDVAGAFQEPLVIRSNPFWIHATGALGRLYPIDQRYASEEDMLERLFDWAERQPKDFKWYGMLNFGDTLTWWRKQDDNQWYETPGWHPVGRWGWYNCEAVGTHTGPLLQFARTGKWKYFEFGGNLARHLMDVDTVHYNTIANDPRLKNVIDDEVSQVGSMHRHNGDHWGGRNEEATHTNVVGILLYAYLTGDERAFDVAKEIGGFYLAEPFTYTQHPDIAPHRAMANALWGDVLLYELIGDERYKKAADKIIEIYLQGQQSDGSFLETYNPLNNSWSGKKHWMFMHSYAVGAFISYHELTQDNDVKEMFLKLMRFLKADPSSIHGAAYAYFISGDPAFLGFAEKGMNELMRNSQRSSDGLYDGLIYKKPIYHRPATFLYTAPYTIEALEAGMKTEQ
ncbi:MAG: hypothetical protein JW893_03425 [Candidatus Omnitrophica bacterium]|nr:hypothetical protein [Candidatus Omnitrophota bacterium]